MTMRMPGISALVRCKDEGESVYMSLYSIKDLVDEIIFVDNASIDNSVSEAKRFKKDHFQNKPLVIRNYLKNTFEKDNLAEINNFALSLTNCEWIFKWDVDTIAYTQGINSILKVREMALSENNTIDDFRFGYYNLWGDLKHNLKGEKNAIEHGPTGCGLEMQGLEHRVYRFDKDIHFTMDSYAEHYWEAIQIPKKFNQKYLDLVGGVHLQTVKPSGLVGRRYFLTRFTPKTRKKFNSFKEFVQSELEKFNYASLEKFGTDLLVTKMNKQGTEYSKKYPSVIKKCGLLSDPKYEFIFEENKCTGRKEPSSQFDYLEENL